MPIRDYEKEAKINLENFYNNEEISETNKGYIKKFMVAYDVKPATQSIFLNYVRVFLAKSKDLKQDMQNREKINLIFKNIRDKQGVVYYSFVVKESLKLVRWLNDNELPKGFKDIKRPKQKEIRRKLNPSDMITWEDGLNLIKATNSQQWKALIMTELDGGFRPSELTDLNFGDIERKKDFIIARVRAGKTGARNVILFKAVPYLLKWLNEHPTKKNDDPLWLNENVSKSHTRTRPQIKKYHYDTIRKRIRDMAARIGFKKPIDIYNFRHSACKLAKKDNLPLDECSLKFGHSIHFFTEVYARSDEDDSIKRLSKAYGITEQKEIKKELNQTCSRCSYINEPKTKMCGQCGSPLSLGEALKVDKGKEEKITKLEKQMAELITKFKSIEEINEEVKKRSLEQK